MLVDRILDRERVQFELLGNRRQILLSRRAVVQPHTSLLILKVLGDVLDRKILELELSVAIEPGVSHVRTIWLEPDPHQASRGRSPPGLELSRPNTVRSPP